MDVFAQHLAGQPKTSRPAEPRRAESSQVLGFPCWKNQCFFFGKVFKGQFEEKSSYMRKSIGKLNTNFSC